MNKLVGIIILAIIVGGVSVYAVSPYFTESTIDEAIPTGAIIQSEIKDRDTIAVNQDETMMEEETMKGETMMEEETMKGETMMEEETMKGETMMEEVLMSYAGTFVGVGDGIHDAQGDVLTITLEDNSNILRLQDFKSTNGPDLYVYLSTDDNASEFINLGELKANNGNQNYDIPEDADLSKYNKVLIWCKAFGVLFGSAELSTQ